MILRNWQLAASLLLSACDAGPNNAPAGPVATLPLLAERLTWAVAPNPAHAAGFVRLLAAPAGAVQLLDAAGRVVRTATVAPAATETHLPVAGLAPGIYLVRAGAQVRRLVLN